MNTQLRQYLSYVKNNGVKSLLPKLVQCAKGQRVIGYTKWFQSHRANGMALKSQSEMQFSKSLLFSVLVPVFNTEPQFLESLVQSLILQSYPQWEACFYDGASSREDTRNVLIQLASSDQRIRVKFGRINEGVSGNTNRALEMAKGDYVAFCDHDDLLAPEALFEFRKRIEETGAQMLYSDEDKIDKTGTCHFEPNFKPDFSPDMLRERNYICHLLVLKKSLVDELQGMNPVYDGSQDHDLILRASERIKRIEHIPKILYHWRMLDTSISHQSLEKCVDASARAVNAHLKRIGLDGSAQTHFPYLHLQYQISTPPAISLILIDDGGSSTSNEALYEALDPAIRDQTSFIVVAKKTKDKTTQSKTLLYSDDEHLPSLLNRAIRQADGQFIALLNASVRPDGSNWLSEMIMHAQRSDIGMVTSAIYDEANRTCHAGYAVGDERVAVCRQKGLCKGSFGYLHLERVTHNVAAVSWAYSVFEKAKWEANQGWDEAFRHQLFDVDLCLRMEKNGLRHVYVPTAPARIMNSKSKKTLFLYGALSPQDVSLLKMKHATLYDPYYNVLLNPRRADFSLPVNYPFISKAGMRNGAEGLK